MPNAQCPMPNARHDIRDIIGIQPDAISVIFLPHLEGNAESSSHPRHEANAHAFKRLEQGILGETLARRCRSSQTVVYFSSADRSAESDSHSTASQNKKKQPLGLFVHR